LNEDLDHDGKNFLLNEKLDVRERFFQDQGIGSDHDVG